MTAYYYSSGWQAYQSASNQVFDGPHVEFDYVGNTNGATRFSGNMVDFATLGVSKELPGALYYRPDGKYKNASMVAVIATPEEIAPVADKIADYAEDKGITIPELPQVDNGNVYAPVSVKSSGGSSKIVLAGAGVLALAFLLSKRKGGKKRRAGK
jgi:hypothetical protein